MEQQVSALGAIIDSGYTRQAHPDKRPVFKKGQRSGQVSSKELISIPAVSVNHFNGAGPSRKYTSQDYVHNESGIGGIRQTGVDNKLAVQRKRNHNQSDEDNLMLYDDVFYSSEHK